jgi:hypothetical protein
MVNFHMSSCINQSGEGDAQDFALMRLFHSSGLFWDENQHPRGAFFNHV